MLSRTSSLLSGASTFAGMRLSKCVRSRSATPGSSIARTIFPSYAVDDEEGSWAAPLAVSVPVEKRSPFALAVRTPIPDGTAKSHNETAAVRNVAYRFVKGILRALLFSMGRAQLPLYKRLGSLAPGTGPRLLAAQPLIIKVLLASTDDVFGSRTTRP